MTKIKKRSPKNLKRAKWKSSEFAPERLTSEQIDKLVDDILNKRIFASVQLRGNECLSAFMPLVFIEEKQLVGLKDCVFYEYYEKAGPNAINGIACFFSFQAVHKDDWNKAMDAVTAKKEAADK